MSKFSGLPKVVGAGVVGLTALTLPFAAAASLVYDSSLLAPAQGFGNAPRILTLQANSTESGSVTVLPGGTIAFGSAIADASVFMGNGVTNSSSTADLPQPQLDNQKYGIPSAGSLGITSANQIGVLFNASEPAGDSVNILDVTLKFFTAAGVFLGAIDGQQEFLSSNPGNGVAGFTFVVDDLQQAYVNSLLALGGAGTLFALEATISDVAGGPETFLIYNIAPSSDLPLLVPEPVSLALLGVGLIGLAYAGRRKPALKG